MALNNNARMKKFLESINIENFSDFDMTFESITKSTVDEHFFVYCICKETPWNFDLLNEFINNLGSITTYRYEIIFTYKKSINVDDIHNFINEYFFDRLSSYLNFTSELDINEVSLSFTNSEDYLKAKTTILDLNELFKFINYRFNVVCLAPLDYVEEKEEEPIEDNVVEEPLSKLDLHFEKNKVEIEEKALQEERKSYENKVISDINKKAFHKGEYIEYNLNELNLNSGAVDIKGTIFELDIRDTKKGGKFCKLGITDDIGAINCIIITGRMVKAEELSSLALGKNISIQGRINMDNYSGGINVMVHSFTMLPDTPLRTDEEENKRIELHLHTNMSEMDGIPTIDRYCKLAKNMGHKAIAVTDHGVVQSFPMAQDAGKKYGIKILYGSELYMIDDYFKGCLNPDNTELKKARYVVFDLESTGLNIRYDRITEIGAVRIVDGMVVDRFNMLINPTIPIPLKIQQKTHISDEMVKNCPTIDEAIPKFMKYVGNDVLISHNIEFDFNLLNEEMVRYGFSELKHSAIDTLQISRFLSPDKAAHSLGAMCRRYEVHYETDKDEDEEKPIMENDNHQAHRADYDAEVLAQCWMIMLPMVIKKLKKTDATLNDIALLPIDNEYLRHWRRGGYHVTVLVKNHDGLKDLYQIITKSHIEHYGVHPFVPRSLLMEHRKNLLIGSSCANGEVFQSAIRRNEKALNKAVEFCDYIELQPLENYSYLVDGGEINTQEELIRTIKDIIKSAEAQNKIIVATGDAHYLNPSDKKYRDIYIESTGVGNTLHPLRHFNSKKPNDYYYPNPEQHFRNTKEMLDCFEYLGKDKAFEYVVTNTNKINEMIDVLNAIPDKLYPPKIENCDVMLRDICYKRAHEWYGENLPELVATRLKSELDGIINNGYAVTYYISHKMVKMSNDKGYLIGSRGSVGSSFAATMAGITEVNPLPPHYRCPKCKHFELYNKDDVKSGFDLEEKRCPECGELMIHDGQNIPFETFLGFHADKVPDIDLNFPDDFQSTAFLFTKELLGEDKVYRAGTIGTVQFKTAYGYVKKYFETFNKHESNAMVSALAYGCCEVKRTTGQHPGGIVVIPYDHVAEDFFPVQFPAGDTDAEWKTTHFEFGSIHDTILKFDMLGHVDPHAVKMMSVLSNFDFKNIPMNDKKVISLFTSDDALNLQHKYLKKDNGASGLPEFGTDLTRQMLRETKPKCFNDLMIISGLSHGTDVWSNNQQDKFKEGLMGINDTIGCRDDIMTYLISKGLPSHEAFTIMELVRKKDKHVSKELIDLMRQHNVPEFYIDACNKIQYLFPKGHACAYVMMAIRVGYYKIYYPLEYYATFFTLRCDGYDIKAMIGGIDAIYNRIQELKEKKNAKNTDDKFTNKDKAVLDMLEVALEMTERGYYFENIDLDRSDASDFIVDYDKKALIPPFKVIDGFGEIAGKTLIEARKQKPFISKEDLLSRGGITQTNMKFMDSIHVLDKLPDNNQLSLFDFTF